MTWAKLFDDVQATGAMPPPIVKKIRRVEIEWYAQVLDENEGFIAKTAADIATAENCDLVRIRADVHNTKSAMVREDSLLSPMPASRRGLTTVAFRGNRIPLVKTFVPAPWHYTVEFRKIGSGKWFNAHVYAETRTVRMGHRLVQGVATGKLSVPDGKDIPSNPELFPPSFRQCTKLENLIDRTYAEVVVN